MYIYIIYVYMCYVYVYVYMYMETCIFMIRYNPSDKYFIFVNILSFYRISNLHISFCFEMWEKREKTVGGGGKGGRDPRRKKPDSFRKKESPRIR